MTHNQQTYLYTEIEESHEDLDTLESVPAYLEELEYIQLIELQIEREGKEVKNV